MKEKRKKHINPLSNTNHGEPLDWFKFIFLSINGLEEVIMAANQLLHLEDGVSHLVISNNRLTRLYPGLKYLCVS